MTDEDILKMIDAFNTLVPADQVAIAAIIFKLATQQKELDNLAKELMKRL